MSSDLNADRSNRSMSLEQISMEKSHETVTISLGSEEKKQNRKKQRGSDRREREMELTVTEDDVISSLR